MGRDQVDLEARVPVEPVADVRVLVRGVVVHHQMQVDQLAVTAAHVAVGPLDLLEERQELRGPCLGFNAAVTCPVAMSSAANRVVVRWRQ